MTGWGEEADGEEREILPPATERSYKRGKDPCVFLFRPFTCRKL